MTLLMRAATGLQVVIAATLIANAAMASGAVVASPEKEALFWSLHQPNERMAINKAMSQCGERFGGGCFLEKSFNYGCLAVARSNSHRHWGYAWRESLTPARYGAMGACDDTGAHTCSIQTVGCEED
jgi:uncharacterized protein DUF4189